MVLLQNNTKVLRFGVIDDPEFCCWGNSINISGAQNGFHHSTQLQCFSGIKSVSEGYNCFVTRITQLCVLRVCINTEGREYSFSQTLKPSVLIFHCLCSDPPRNLCQTDCSRIAGSFQKERKSQGINGGRFPTHKAEDKSICKITYLYESLTF